MDRERPKKPFYREWQLLLENCVFVGSCQRIKSDFETFTKLVYL